jgi:hypothetical protein
MLSSWPKFIIAIASFYIAVPMLLSLVRYRQLGYAMRIMACYVTLGAITQFASSYMNSKSQNNLWMLHLYTPLEFSCITWFYSVVLEGIAPKKWFVLTALGFAVLSALNTAFLQDSLTFNTYARCLEGLLVIVFCLIWCYKTLSEMKISRLERDPVFWVNTGFLLYFSGNILLFAFSNYILNINRALNHYIWAFHAIFNLLLYLFITVGLWKAK